MGSEPSSGCQVSTGRYLINRTFPLLNLRRMDGNNGCGDLASYVLAHEAVSWVHLPLQLSIHACQAWADRRQVLARSCTPLPVFPSSCPCSSFGPFSFPFLLSPVPWQVSVATTFISWAAIRQDSVILAHLSADFLYLFSLWFVRSTIAQIIFSWTVTPPPWEYSWLGWWLGPVREEGISRLFTDFIIGVSSHFVWWDPTPQKYDGQWCSSDSPRQSEAFLLLLNHT